MPKMRTGEDLALLYMTKDELGIALASVAAAIITVSASLKVAQSPEIRRALEERMVIANSLRTAFAEARWSLMTPEEIEKERQDREVARAAGIIVD